VDRPETILDERVDAAVDVHLRTVAPVATGLARTGIDE
jgi:hypothetical protein